MRSITLFAALMMFVGCCGNKTSEITLMDASAFRTTVDGKQTELYTLTNGSLTMQVTNFGARVVTLWAPDRNGHMADIVLGYQNIDRYINNSGERFLGSVVDRSTHQ